MTDAATNIYFMASESSVATGHVRLYLVVEEDSMFYLEIPLDVIHALCLNHRKYLLYLGWCILGVEGSLSLLDARGKYRRIPPVGNLDEERYYYIVTDRGTVLFLDHKCGTRYNICLWQPSPLLTSRSSRRERVCSPRLRRVASHFGPNYISNS